MKIGKIEAQKIAQSLIYGTDGLLPVVSVEQGSVLMLAYANKQAVARTLSTGFAWFYSRSRKALWKKGETSGNRMRVLAIEADCDSDALIYRVQALGKGIACHKGRKSCFAPFGGKEEGDSASRLSFSELASIMEARIAGKVKGSYTAKLVASPNYACGKVKEEAAELVEAVQVKHRKEVIWETCDLLYHTLAAARCRGIVLADLERELARRHRLKEK